MSDIVTLSNSLPGLKLTRFENLIINIDLNEKTAATYFIHKTYAALTSFEMT